MTEERENLNFSCVSQLFLIHKLPTAHEREPNKAVSRKSTGHGADLVVRAFHKHRLAFSWKESLLTDRSQQVEKEDVKMKKPFPHGVTHSGQ